MECWNNEEYITKWNFAGSDWHCPSTTNDFIEGEEFQDTMAAKDNSISFDFWGTYQKIEVEKSIEILLRDGRKILAELFKTVCKWKSYFCSNEV